jgi:hypothetical protein
MTKRVEARRQRIAALSRWIGRGRRRSVLGAAFAV